MDLGGWAVVHLFECLMHRQCIKAIADWRKRVPASDYTWNLNSLAAADASYVPWRTAGRIDDSCI